MECFFDLTYEDDEENKAVSNNNIDVESDCKKEIKVIDIDCEEREVIDCNFELSYVWQAGERSKKSVKIEREGTKVCEVIEIDCEEPEVVDCNFELDFVSQRGEKSKNSLKIERQSNSVRKVETIDVDCNSEENLDEKNEEDLKPIQIKTEKEVEKTDKIKTHSRSSFKVN